MYSSLPMATATIHARHVQPGDTIEYPDVMTGLPVRRVVLDVSGGWVWVNGQRLDTVCLATDPRTGRGPVMAADDVVTVVVDDEPPAGSEPFPGEPSWW